MTQSKFQDFAQGLEELHLVNAGLTSINKLNDSSYQFILVKQIVQPEPKSLKEAKGYIVSDYQEYLEKTWLESLRNKYPIKLDESVFKSLVKK